MGSGQSQPAPESKPEAQAGPAIEESAGSPTMAASAASQPSQSAAQQKEEREEGEIADDDDDEVQIVSNHTASNSAKRPRPDDVPVASKNSQKNKRKKARKAQRQQEQAHAAQVMQPPQLNPNAAPFPRTCTYLLVRLGRARSLTLCIEAPSVASKPASSKEEKSESKKLVAEFLSWGVGPDYLVGYGISKELIAACLVELNHPIPPFLAHLAPRSTASLAPPESSSTGPSEAPGPVPSEHAVPRGSSTPYTRPEQESAKAETPAASAKAVRSSDTLANSTTPRDTPKLPSSLPAKPQTTSTPTTSLPRRPQSGSAVSAAPSSSKSMASSSQNEIRSDQSSAQPTPESRAQPDMQAHERAVRERLMARRQSREAELAKAAAKPGPTRQDVQNVASKHESVQQDIDGLFASAMLDSPSLSRTEEQSSFPFDQPPPPFRPGVPFAPSELSVSSTLRPSHHHMATSQASARPAAFASNPVRRPKATDFEAEPAAPSAAFVPTARPLFLGDDSAPVSVVIEFDEDDFSSDDEAVASSSSLMAPLSAALNQASGSSSSQSTPKPAADALFKSDQQDGEMKQQLAEKEKEIKAMMERINRMESKSKKKGAKQSPGPPPEPKAPTPTNTQQPVTTPASAVSASATDSEMLVNAQDQVERLQGEHNALLADQIAAESISQSQGDIFPEASNVNPLMTRPMHVVEEADVEMANDLESSAQPPPPEEEAQLEKGGASEMPEGPPVMLP